MNSGVPWNINDVRPQARDTALEAARRCNMSVGDWLSNVIVAQAARQGATLSPSELQARDAEERELAETMERIGRHLEQSALPSSVAIPEPLPPQPRGPEAYAPRRAMEQPAPAPAPSSKLSPALAQAMAEIAARQRALDADATSPQQAPSPASPAETSSAPSPALSGLEKQLRQLTAQIENLHRPNSVENAINALRNDLAEIGQAITQAMPRQAIEALESEIRKLAKQVEQNRQSIDRASIAGMERRLGEMLASLQALTPAERLAGVDEALSGLGRKLDQIAATKQDAGSLPQFEAAIIALRRVVSRVASSAALSKLRDEVRELSSQIKPPHQVAPVQHSLASVHETIKRLGDRLTMSQTDLQSVAGAASGVRTAVSSPPAIAIQPSPPVAAQVKREPASAQKRQPVDPNLAADHPLEPGSGIPARRLVASAAERIATPETAAGGAKTAPHNSGLTDFIAAARRAAKAASPSLSSNTSAAEGKETPEGGKSLAQRMRSLLPGASVLLLALGSFYAVINPHTPLPKPAVSEAPAEQNQPSPPALAGLVHTIQSVSDAPPQLSRSAAEEKAAIPLPTSPPRADGNEVTGSLPALPEGPSSSHALVPALPQQGPQLSDKLPSSLRKAAANGNPAAEYEVALRHLEGRGVPQSSEEAARWLDRAAKSGLVPAQFRLGSLYEKGHGVKKNRDMARALYLIAAENGNAKAMHNLAVLYAEGIAGKPDYQAAALWFRKAASHGIADSQYNLGILYARGAGVEQNLAESYKWFSLAAAQGDKESITKREDVGARLDPQARMAAQVAVQAFVVEPQPEEATIVKAPEGGWDRPSVGTSPAAPQKKRLATPRP